MTDLVSAPRDISGIDNRRDPLDPTLFCVWNSSALTSEHAVYVVLLESVAGMLISTRHSRTIRHRGSKPCRPSMGVTC